MPKITKAGGVSFDPAGPEGNPDVGTFAESAGLAGATVPVDEAQATIDEAYDPADYTVIEVNAYLDQCRDDENRDEFERVIAAEEAGRARAGIVNRASGG